MNGEYGDQTMELENDSKEWSATTANNLKVVILPRKGPFKTEYSVFLIGKGVGLVRPRFSYTTET
jgi:hypothetical protein